MKLNHINLTVTDVTAAASFLTTYFGLINRGGNAGMTLLTDAEGHDGMVLTLMKAKQAAFRGYPETFHVGFYIDSKDEVDRLSAQLRGDGFDAGVPADTGHSYGFYVKAPGEFTVEVGA